MNNKSESKRLADAVAVLAGTILEIINEKMKVVMEARSATETASPSNPASQTVWEGWVRKKELAKHLNISLRTVDNWIRNGKLPHIRMGARNVRFKLSEVDEALNRSCKRHARW
jgi:excisionase family DNA binding protein